MLAKKMKHLKRQQRLALKKIKPERKKMLKHNYKVAAKFKKWSGIQNVYLSKTSTIYKQFLIG